MTTRFADAFYYIALLDSTDQHHAKVRDRAATAREQHVTTRWVLAEVADALAAPHLRGAARQLLQRLEADADTCIVTPSDDLYRRGLLLYGERSDKAWSLTDCISFAVMETRGLTESLTGDRHFHQAGFSAVFMD